MLAANVMPVGLPAQAERYQPSTITRPIALPVTGQRHFPCSGSSGRFRTSHAPRRTTRTPMTAHAGRPSAAWSVAGWSSIAYSKVWSVVRTGWSTPTLVALAPIANPSSTTHAPSAPSPSRYHELPAQPPPRIMPMPKTKPPVRLASHRNGRTGIDSTSPSSSTWTPTIAIRSART